MKLHGELSQGYVIVPDQAGELTLPALRLGWWDVLHNRERVATLPAQTLNVTAATDSRGAQIGTSIAGNGDALNPRGLLPGTLQQLWPWLVLLPGAILLAAIMRRYRHRWQTLAARIARAMQRHRCLVELRRACLAGDAHAAYPALIAWARQHWRERGIIGLGAIAARARAAGWSDQLAMLDAARFAHGASAWRGDDLWRLVRIEQRGRRAGRARAHVPCLPALYPQAATRDFPGRAVSSPRTA